MPIAMVMRVIAVALSRINSFSNTKGASIDNRLPDNSESGSMMSLGIALLHRVAIPGDEEDEFWKLRSIDAVRSGIIIEQFPSLHVCPKQFQCIRVLTPPSGHRVTPWNKYRQDNSADIRVPGATTIVSSPRVNLVPYLNSRNGDNGTDEEDGHGDRSDQEREHCGSNVRPNSSSKKLANLERGSSAMAVPITRISWPKRRKPRDRTRYLDIRPSHRMSDVLKVWKHGCMKNTKGPIFVFNTYTHIHIHTHTHKHTSTRTYIHGDRKAKSTFVFRP